VDQTDDNWTYDTFTSSQQDRWWDAGEKRTPQEYVDHPIFVCFTKIARIYYKGVPVYWRVSPESKVWVTGEVFFTKTLGEEAPLW
jgi:hypothetical protein